MHRFVIYLIHLFFHVPEQPLLGVDIYILVDLCDKVPPPRILWLQFLDVCAVRSNDLAFFLTFLEGVRMRDSEMTIWTSGSPPSELTVSMRRTSLIFQLDLLLHQLLPLLSTSDHHRAARGKPSLWGSSIIIMNERRSKVSVHWKALTKIFGICDNF